MSIRSKYARVFDQTDEMKWTMVNAIDAIRTPYNFVSHIFRLYTYVQDGKIRPWNKQMNKIFIHDLAKRHQKTLLDFLSYCIIKECFAIIWDSKLYSLNGIYIMWILYNENNSSVNLSKCILVYSHMLYSKLKSTQTKSQLFCLYRVAVVKADSTVKQHQ